MYDIRITSEGRRHLDCLATKVRDAAFAALSGSIKENPRRMGKPLVGELTGLCSARRVDYRIVYEIDDETTTVIVHQIHHRSSVYRSR